MVPIFEPLGLASAGPGTLIGYEYTWASVVAIAVSAILGLLVSLSTFLVIGATSSLTYNVVGHVKTVIILMGGCLFFGDEMPLKKLAGISVAMCGIIWYSQLKLAASAASSRGGAMARPSSPGKASAKEALEPLLSSLSSSTSGTKRRQNDHSPKKGDIEEARI
jgi:solute carrier family 35 protein E3